MTDCPHGQSSRQCEICELEAERDRWEAHAVRVAVERDRLRAVVEDIAAHANPIAEDDDGFVAVGYTVTVGAIHRALAALGQLDRSGNIGRALPALTPPPEDCVHESTGTYRQTSCRDCGWVLISGVWVPPSTERLRVLEAECSRLRAAIAERTITPEEPGRALSQWVARRREQLGLTQTQLAERIGRSESWVSQVERGVRHVDRLSVIERLRAVLDEGAGSSER